MSITDKKLFFCPLPIKSFHVFTAFCFSFSEIQSWRLSFKFHKTAKIYSCYILLQDNLLTWPFIYV